MIILFIVFPLNTNRQFKTNYKKLTMVDEEAQKLLRYSYKVVLMESKFFNDYYSDIKSSNNQNVGSKT